MKSTCSGLGLEPLKLLLTDLIFQSSRFPVIDPVSWHAGVRLWVGKESSRLLEEAFEGEPTSA